MIEEFRIASLIDVVIVFTLVEALVLVLYHRSSGRGVAPRDFLANMISGLCLMFALRCLATETNVTWVAAFLAAAGLAHGVDILRRWKRPTGTAAVTRGASA